MKSKKISVVIPAFNAGQYIEDCVLSILSQDGAREFISIIVVIDGCTDDTQYKVKNISQQNEKIIKYVIQENLGPSAARNNGLRYVETDYITFLDADDLWAPDYFKKILPFLEEEPDIIEYDASRMSQDGFIINTIKIACAENKSKKEIRKNDFLSIFRCYAWARVYKTSLIREHPFPEDRRFEDTATTPWYYWNSRKIISVGEPLVCYRQHKTSILATPRKKDVEEIARCIEEAVEMYKNTNDDYWRVVVYRIFHFACQRITTQSFKDWHDCIRISVQAVSDVAPPPGAKRKLQRHATPIYVFLLYIRYTVSNFAEKIIPKKILGWLFPER